MSDAPLDVKLECDISYARSCSRTVLSWFTLRSMACSQRQQRWFESCHAVALTLVAPLARLGFAEISSTGAEVLTTGNWGCLKLTPEAL